MLHCNKAQQLCDVNVTKYLQGMSVTFLKLESKCSVVPQTKDLGFVFCQIFSGAQRPKQGCAGEHAGKKPMFTDPDSSEMCVARTDSPSHYNWGREI